MLKENNVRKGFFEHNEYLALRNELPPYLKPFVTFAYKFGWRDEEIADLTWSQVDRVKGIVTLEVAETKNGTLIPNVFSNEKGNGPIVNFRKAWNAACRKAGLGYGYKVGKRYVEKWQDKLPSGPILHDFRRTAVRNMIRSGIPERVAMLISGHKTRSVFDRYNIVSDADLKLATQRQEAYLKSAAGTIADFEQKNRSAD
jgi:integrase